jgi:hypothetical protein
MKFRETIGFSAVVSVRSSFRRAPTAEWAVESAKEQFASLEGIPNWKIHAALIEIEPIEIEPVEPEPKRNAKTLAPRI